MAKKSKVSPLPLLALGGAAAFVLTQTKKAKASTPGKLPAAPAPTLPAAPAPSGAPSQTVSANGHAWKLVQVPGKTEVDVFAPAGSWGPHGELRVLRYDQPSSASPRVLVGVAEGVPKAVLDAAMKDLKVTAPAGPTVMTPPGRPPMPTALQQEMIATMMALGVDSSGVVQGPVTAEAVRRATELSSRLDQAGYPEAAAAMRGYAQQAAKKLPPPAATAPAIPGVPPDLMAQIQRALELERDPAKLEALRGALLSLPASAERDLLVGALDALILQVRSAQAISTAATEIDEQLKRPPASASPRLLKLVTPNQRGEDVRAWQNVLVASGYPVTADGVFGPKTSEATKDWQRKRALTPDGVVGPRTLAAVGRPPTAPVSVPATASPQPDPRPKTPLEVAAEAAVTHLRAVQSKYGVKGAKGKEDKTLVKRFQAAAGGVADGLTGPGTLLAAARAGQGTLPAVMYWPKSATRSQTLPAYQAELRKLAAAAAAQGRASLAAQLEASAQRETGAGGL